MVSLGATYDSSANIKRARDGRAIGRGSAGTFEGDAEEAARDPETGESGELDMEDPEAREYVGENVHPWFADAAAQFLVSTGEPLTAAR